MGIASAQSFSLNKAFPLRLAMTFSTNRLSLT